MTADPGTQAMPTPKPTSGGTAAKLLIPVAVGAAVSVAIGVYGKAHTPTGIAVSVAGFSGPQTVKVWLATGAVTFAIVQLITALVMYGKFPGVTGPPWTGTLHRWSGRIAFLFSIPVAVHCLYAIGFSTFDARTVMHSLLGCAFFGAFTMKMLILPKKGLPGWVLPLAGGLVFTALVGLWLTSSWWFFITSGVKF